LQHLYEREPERFRVEAVAVLTSDRVRFHIKETVLAVLSNFGAPSSEDAEVIFEVSATGPTYENQLWLHTRRDPWFRRFYEDGTIASWLGQQRLNTAATRSQSHDERGQRDA
jgi:hypothetical protein